MAVKYTVVCTKTPSRGGPAGRHAGCERRSDSRSRSLPSGGFGSSTELLQERNTNQRGERYCRRVIRESAFLVANGSNTYVIRSITHQTGERIGIRSHIYLRPFGFGGFLVLEFPCFFAVILDPTDFCRGHRQGTVRYRQVGRFEASRRQSDLDIIDMEVIVSIACRGFAVERNHERAAGISAQVNRYFLSGSSDIVIDIHCSGIVPLAEDSPSSAIIGGSQYYKSVVRSRCSLTATAICR